MKIIEKPSRNVRFEDIGIDETFRWSENVYIRCMVFEDKFGTPMNCFRLNPPSRPARFLEDSLVERREFQLVEVEE